MSALDLPGTRPANIDAMALAIWRALLYSKVTVEDQFFFNMPEDVIEQYRTAARAALMASRP